MASSKDIPQTSTRPSAHRFSVSNSGSLPARSHTRNSSSLSGSLNPNHRITRRKSVSQNSANVAAVAAAAAARDIGDNSFSMPAARRHTVSRSLGKSSMHTPPSSLPTNRLSITAKHAVARDENAIDDEEIDDFEDDEESFDKNRQRRASEGQSVKGEGKKSKDDLRCTKCGKGYKHSSCLTKHLWEHTPEWSYTSKLLISKHQQVQLLEAASVLVAMNADGSTPPESSKDFQSDEDSASPAASGSSDQRDGLSSVDTTPPPQDVQHGQSYSGNQYPGRSKRYSSGNNYSRSYQSAPYSLGHAESAPNGSGFGNRSRSGSERRPLSSGMTTGGQEDEAGLATAIEMLSCSFGTPRSGPVTMSPDVPPVPPLPAQYLGQSAFSGSTLTTNFQGASTSYVRGGGHHDKDVKMEETDGSIVDDDEYDAHSRGRSDEDDDGVFGRMEE